MSAGRRGHTKLRLPAKGTKRRELLRLLMRPQGCMAEEQDLFKHALFITEANRLADFFDFDLRSFPTGRPLGRPGRRPMIYRIVGATRNGRYRSFIRNQEN